MTDVEIHRFTPEDADDVRTALAIITATSAEDSPWQHVWLPETYDAVLRYGWDGEPSTPFLMTVDGEAVGHASLYLPQRENRHLAWVGLSVMPEQRRRGYGSMLLERMIEEAKADDRTSIGIDGWDSERSLGFAARHGLERRSQAIQRRQYLNEIAPDVIQKLHDEAARVAVDYELVRIFGRTPDDLMAPMVELTAAINDAPTDDLDIEDDVMSAERLREYETSVLRHGNRMYRLVARHRETGELGGHTVVAVEERRPTIGDQHDTAVARAHRGHRLGLLLKAGMLLWLAEAEPQVETIDTWNAESNDHMIAVNETLGYRILGRELQFQKDI
jgi:GNAT superfamily N-acetyltransferase